MRGRSSKFGPQDIAPAPLPHSGRACPRGCGPGTASAELPTLRELPGLGWGSRWDWAAGCALAVLSSSGTYLWTSTSPAAEKKQ